jgi:hypothetical protein
MNCGSDRVVVHTCNPSYLGGGGGKIVVRGYQGKIARTRPYLKNKQSKKYWGCGSSGRTFKALSSTPIPPKKKKKC